MILFTADLHIKLGQKNVPVDWALHRYNLYFDQIRELEDKVDLHIMGGDIFDKLPNLEELKLYFKMISRITIPTIIFDGNHEATKKGATFFDALRDVTEQINPLVSIVTQTTEYSNFIIVPYTEIHTDIWGSLPSKPVFTHVRGEIPPHVKPEIDLDILNKFPIVFAGDLHSHSNSQRNIVYPGSPMTIGFHRNKVKTGYLLIDSEDLTRWTWNEFQLPQLIRKTVEKEEDIIPTSYDHTIYELVGTVDSLSAVKGSDILDKKLFKRESLTSLDFSSSKSIQEELSTYLNLVLALPKEKIEIIMGVFNASTPHIKLE